MILLVLILAQITVKAILLWSTSGLKFQGCFFFSVGFLTLVFCNMKTRFSQCQIIPSELQIDELLIFWPSFDVEEVEV